MATVEEADFVMQAHDLLPVIGGRASVESTGTTINLTGADSVKFIMREAGDDWQPVFTGAATVNTAADIVGPPENGDMEYAWEDGDTDTPGFYVGQFQITWTTGLKPQTVPTKTYITIAIVADLDNA